MYKFADIAVVALGKTFVIWFEEDRRDAFKNLTLSVEACLFSFLGDDLSLSRLIEKSKCEGVLRLVFKSSKISLISICELNVRLVGFRLFTVSNGVSLGLVSRVGLK